MRLNKTSSGDHPSVTQTSNRTILWVMLEVCPFTALLGLGTPTMEITSDRWRTLA